MVKQDSSTQVEWIHEQTKAQPQARGSKVLEKELHQVPRSQGHPLQGELELRLWRSMGLDGSMPKKKKNIPWTIGHLELQFPTIRDTFDELGMRYVFAELEE
ncbi:hypothetical protein HAX54_004153 [Datura stramonium]|uniref:Uncharacterized protein n=1 Tax=Datura stramonium TaxID=4076 RepID=A0ABS8T793_DATST|nr:hypothetical protein [Datura stramonium]